MEEKKMIEVATEEKLTFLGNAFPVVKSKNTLSVERLGMLSQDLMEGKNKEKKVTQEAGTFFIEHGSEEVIDGKKKRVWNKEYISDKNIDVIIFFHRKQLRLYNKASKRFINSPIYNEDDEILPLYELKSEIARGTPKQLQARYPALTTKGKQSSELKETRILYVLYNNEIYQMNLSESSKYEFLTYAGENTVPHVVTTLAPSVEQQVGSNTYKKITFKSSRPINKSEADKISEEVNKMIEYLEERKEKFSSQIKSDEDF